MDRSPKRRLLMTAAATLAATALAAPPAVAADMFFSKSSGQLATVSWLEVGKLPAAANAPGNAHFGDLWVEDLGRGRARVFGTVFDVQCDEGVTPYNPGGGHGEPAPHDVAEPGPTGCTLKGVRFIEGGDVTFTLDNRLSRATLTGSLAVGSGHGASTVAPPVNITWNGIGEIRTTRESGTMTDEFGTFTFRYTSTGRDAEIATGSRIGPMVFDDEPGEDSTASLASFRSMSRSRS